MRGKRCIGGCALLCLVACASLQKRQEDAQEAARHEGDRNAANVAVAQPPASTRGQQSDHQEANVWGTIPDWLMVAVTAAGLIAAFKNLSGLTAQITESKKAADAAKATADASLLAERAYIAISHSEGLHLREDPRTERGVYRLPISVINQGRTPATVHGGAIVLVPRLAQDGIPKWMTNGKIGNTDMSAMLPGTFLHANDTMNVEPLFFESQTLIGWIAADLLWIVGYVDYTDEFQQSHRSGYCRWVKVLGPDPNNLVFDQASARFNYDRTMTEEERQQYQST